MTFLLKKSTHSARNVSMTLPPYRKKSGRIPSPRHCLFLLCSACLLLLLLRPAPVMETVREALRICGETIIPSLFPFFVFSALLTSLAPMDAIEKCFAPFMRPLFHVSGSCAAVLVLGFTGGYPVGVRTAAALYHQGRLERGETLRLLSFCNNSGPGFLVGIMGLGVLQSAAAGLWLYLIHILAALLVGILFRFYHDHSIPILQPISSQSRSTAHSSMSRLFIEAVTGSMMSVLNICAFVLFFMIVLRLLSLTGILHICAALLTLLLSPFGMTEHLSAALIAGTLELSTGAIYMQGAPLTPGTAALASFLLGWGGISVHCQSLLFLMEARLPCATYIAGKLMQGILSALLAFALFSLL